MTSIPTTHKLVAFKEKVFLEAGILGRVIYLYFVSYLDRFIVTCSANRS